MKELCFFVSDLHGRTTRYAKLLEAILTEKPGLVLLGGDLLPHARQGRYADFLTEYLGPQLHELKSRMADEYPFIGLILGNDDPRNFEPSARWGEDNKLWHYLHFRRKNLGPYDIVGYACVPPTPFLLKDWERYDVSRFTDPGSIPPSEGIHTAEPPAGETADNTIQADIERLNAGGDPARTLFLFHAPPYQTDLDRAGLDGKYYEGVPLDVHVGSIAIKRFIEQQQPWLTLHGHIHESSSLTGKWKQKIGTTHCLSAAWDGPELALICFSTEAPQGAERILL